MTQRIFNDPNHAAYGPVRRVWVMLAGLDLLDNSLDELYFARYAVRWDACMADAITDKGMEEFAIARLVVGRMIAIRRM